MDVTNMPLYKSVPCTCNCFPVNGSEYLMRELRKLTYECTRRPILVMHN